MIPGARLILLGRQGAGKGTQCVRLSRHFVVPHISTGDMLRAAVREGTELGVMAKQVMDQGNLVGDEIMVGIVRERLVAVRRRGPRLHPRRLSRVPSAQAKALDEITAELPLDAVLDLDVPRDLVLQRLSARRVCRDCGTNYVANGTEKSPWICEVCGGDVMHRDDDTPEAIDHRLDLYEQQTSPLIEYYSEQGRMVVIDGVATPDEVFRRLTSAVESMRRRGLMARCVGRGGIPRRTAEELRHMRAAGQGGGRDARGGAGRGQARRHHRIARPGGTRRPRTPPCHIELLRIPRLPGRHLHVGERRGGARHPRQSGAGGGRPAVGRLWRHRERLARRRRVQHGHRHHHRPTRSG